MGNFGGGREVITSGSFNSNGSGKSHGDSLSGLGTVTKHSSRQNHDIRLCLIRSCDQVACRSLRESFSVQALSTCEYETFMERIIQMGAGNKSFLYYLRNLESISLFFSNEDQFMHNRD